MIVTTTELKRLFVRDKEQVYNLLAYNDLSFGLFQFDMGLGYLDLMLNNDTWCIKVMSESPLYWEWFIMQWRRIDHRWLKHADLTQPREALLAEYQYIHRPDRLNYYPTEVIRELFKPETQKQTV